MESIFGQPSKLLKPYIQSYWVYETEEGVVDEMLLPNGYVDFTINISGADVVTKIGNKAIALPSTEILGQLTLPGRVTASKGTVLLIARFYPYATSLFFPCPASYFTNRSTDLGEVLKGESEKLLREIMAPFSFREKFAVLDTFLAQRLIYSEKKESDLLLLLEQACSWIGSNVEQFNLEHIEAITGFSKRHVQHIFLDWVGISPRKYFSIKRFNRSLDLLRTLTYPLTSIALECGYYDQAHFIREFKKLTGMTPSKVRQTLVGQ
ncbi:MAG: helix-turn-helix transcriptional regulator [Vallitaleaceae bacterium]|nr:helix-turn-helix transcriptional regulator [Vallitaleaceae bacterium]